MSSSLLSLRKRQESVPEKHRSRRRGIPRPPKSSPDPAACRTCRENLCGDGRHASQEYRSEHPESLLADKLEGIGGCEIGPTIAGAP